MIFGPKPEEIIFFILRKHKMITEMTTSYTLYKAQGEDA
jgi:hypothetical protein